MVIKNPETLGDSIAPNHAIASLNLAQKSEKKK